MEGDWRKERTRRAEAALIDTSVPNAARVGDVLYGGPNNFEADRKAVRSMMAVAPVVSTIVPAVRAFRQRVVRHLAAEAGIRQFLDIGTGLAGSTHEIAQAVDPACRIVYVDNDPVVLSHARAELTSAPGGVTTCVDADRRDAGAIVAAAKATLDFGQPVAIMLFATLAFTPDTAEAAAFVSSLMDAVAPGSYIAIYHQASDLHPALSAAARRWNQLSSTLVTLRSRDEITSFVDGLELVQPGLVPVCDWRPTPRDPRFDDLVPLYGVVARKPGGGMGIIDDWQEERTRRARAALVNATVPNPARVLDYLDGGRNNFEADRKAAHSLIAAAPVVATIAPAWRAFHCRVVQYLVHEAGVRQFLYMGASLASSSNTDELVRSVDKDSRIVFADTDPVVLAHVRALMRPDLDTGTGYVDAGVRDLEAVVAGAKGTLDWGEPVAVMLMSTLVLIADTAEAAAIVSALADAAPSGSYLAIHHIASDLHPGLSAAARLWNRVSPEPVTLRSKTEVASLVAGLVPVEPGVVPITQWRPGQRDRRFAETVPLHGVVARKPS